jgi:hypothetical protein
VLAWHGKGGLVVVKPVCAGGGWVGLFSGTPISGGWCRLEKILAPSVVGGCNGVARGQCSLCWRHCGGYAILIYSMSML